MLFVDQLEMLNSHVRAISKRIDELLAQHPDARIFRSFPGMGPVTAATMLAEMGEDRGRFPTADVLLAESGTAPVTRSSGRTRTVRFRYAANKRMRHAIDWWTFVAIREDRLGATPTTRPGPTANSTTARSAASAPAGPGSCGAAGPTTAPTTPTDTGTPPCPPTLTDHRNRHRT